MKIFNDTEAEICVNTIKKVLFCTSTVVAVAYWQKKLALQLHHTMYTISQREPSKRLSSMPNLKMIHIDRFNHYKPKMVNAPEGLNQVF